MQTVLFSLSISPESKVSTTFGGGSNCTGIMRGKMPKLSLWVTKMIWMLNESLTNKKLKHFVNKRTLNILKFQQKLDME